MSEDLQRELAGLGEGGDPRGVEMGAVERRVGERRRRRAAAVAGVLACVVAVPLGWAAVGGTGSGTAVAPATRSAASCPPSLTSGWSVPAPPKTLDLEGRLAPRAAPQSVTICRYEPSTEADSRELVGERSVQDGRDRVGPDLAEVTPRAREDRFSCMMLSTRTPYVVRLDYPQGAVWVAADADDSCAYEDTETSNGEGRFDHVGNDLAAAYEAGRWVGLGPQRCADATVQRRGAAARLVPPGVESATICSLTSAGTYETRSVVEGSVDDLVRALSAAPLVRASQEFDTGRAMRCSPGGSVPATRQVVLRYDHGPAVVVSVYPGCDPQLITGSRRAGLTPELRELLDLPAES
ncbi:hypothetical protein [Janibacter melonis]|uniref:hypothetical protein n=1 Tax=Janibacter melonis TaxID=262209 RepID=UPI00191B3D1A|nr:hypothetical protein [Janibacter melonis]